jgi:hypothetical protein
LAFFHGFYPFFSFLVFAPGETPLANPKDVRKSFFAMRKKNVVESGLGDSGNTVCCAVIVEDCGKPGPLVSALMPQQVYYSAWALPIKI